jgi:hypothetical protein
MNRHERRRRASLGRGRIGAQNPSDDPEYRKVLEAMVFAFKVWFEQNGDREVPRFRVGPREVMLIADLDAPFAQGLALNESARETLELCCVAGKTVRGKVPSVMQLFGVLEWLQLPVKRVSLGELGLTEGDANN